MSLTRKHKDLFRPYVEGQATPGDWGGLVRALFAPDAVINVVHPINDCTGSEDYLDRFLAPLAAAFRGLHRRDDIVIAGHFEGGDWISATGHYAGYFSAPFLGIAPTDTLAFLRFGEFHRFDGDRVVESYIFLDLPQLMIAAGQWPITDSPGTARGYTGLIPGPATQDGLQWHDNDPAHSADGQAFITAMLQKLTDPAQGWRPYWHDNMLWYGPAAFGTFIGIEDFWDFKRPFSGAFDKWGGGAAGTGRTTHFTRYADGDYMCIGGWPSLSGIQRKPFMGQPATNEMLYMRVCDWWRRSGDHLMENWVFVDIPDVLLQMNVDLFPGLHDVTPSIRTQA